MQKLRHLNSSTVDNDGVLQTTVSFGWSAPSYDTEYQSRQIVYSPVESASSPTDIWIVGVMIDLYAGGVKRYACYPVLGIWDKITDMCSVQYEIALNQIRKDLNLETVCIVEKCELLNWSNVELTYSDSGTISSVRKAPRKDDAKVTTLLLEAAGIDVDNVFPKLYHKLNHKYSRDLPSICKYDSHYFNVEFTENIDLLGHYDIVGYDYGLRIRTLPRFYEIHSSGRYAEGPNDRVTLGFDK